MSLYELTIRALLDTAEIPVLCSRALELLPKLVEQRARHWTKGAHGYFTGSYSDGAGGSGGKGLDKSGGSGIIKARQLAQEKKFNYCDFDEVVDEKSVSELKQYAAEKMGISHISGIDRLKNGRQAHELLSKVEELSETHGKCFAQISLVDYGDAKTVAETVGNELRLNVQYLNRPGALQAVLDEWEKTSHIPKGCNRIDYVSSHEYAHLLTQDAIDKEKSKIATEIRRQNLPAVSDNARKDMHEYVADLLSAKKLSPKQEKLKETIINIAKKG